MAVNTYIHTPVNYVELEDKTDELEVNQQVYLQTKNNKTMCKRTKTLTKKENSCSSVLTHMKAQTKDSLLLPTKTDGN